jgi:hypothetical protein
LSEYSIIIFYPVSEGEPDIGEKKQPVAENQYSDLSDICQARDVFPEKF